MPDSKQELEARNNAIDRSITQLGATSSQDAGGKPAMQSAVTNAAQNPPQGQWNQTLPVPGGQGGKK